MGQSHLQRGAGAEKVQLLSVNSLEIDCRLYAQNSTGPTELVPGAQNLGKNIAKGTTDPRVEFWLPK